MARNRFTQRNGQYDGPGDDISWAMVGDHERQGVGFGFPGNAWAAYKHCYGFSQSSSFNDLDFTQRNTGTGSATVMVAGGLQLTSGSAATTDDAQCQSLRAFTPVAGKQAIAFCRFQLDDITHPLFFFGFGATVTDWGAGEATDNAVFLMAAGGATIVGRSKDGATGSSTATLFTAVAATDYDLVVLIDGVTAVEYRWKAATASQWNVSRKTTNLPVASQRLTFGIGSGESASNNLLLARYGFWAEHGNVI